MVYGAKKSAPSTSGPEAQLDTLLSSAMSEFLLLLHGLAAAVLIFLFILAVKRRLQFK